MGSWSKNQPESIVLPWIRKYGCTDFYVLFCLAALTFRHRQNFSPRGFMFQHRTDTLDRRRGPKSLRRAGMRSRFPVRPSSMLQELECATDVSSTCTLRKIQKERSLMPLAIIKIHIQQVNPQGDQHSHDCRTIPLGHCFFLRWKLVITQSIYTLKLEIAHSGSGNLSGDTTAYITTHEHLIKYLDVVWGVANCNTT